MSRQGVEDEPQRAQGTPGRSLVRRYAVLVTAAVVIVCAAYSYRQSVLRASGPGTLDDRLRGSADDAIAALEERLGVTPEAKRPALLIRFADDPSPNLRYAAVDALGDLRKPETADTIERAFRDCSSQVRQRAAEVLHAVARERGVRLLLTALRDEDTWVRESAAMQLMMILRDEKIPMAPFTPSLIAAMNADDPVVCRTSTHILARRIGKPWRIRAGMSPAERDAVIARWRRWWSEQAKAPGANLAPLPEPIRPARADRAPAWRVRDLAGRTWSLAGQRGRLTLLHFWGTWCPACVAELPALTRLHREYEPRGLDIVGLAIEERGAAGLKRWLAERNIQSPQALATPSILHAYGSIHEVPVSVLMDRSGMIRYRWDGERDYATYAAAVSRLVSE